MAPQHLCGKVKWSPRATATVPNNLTSIVVEVLGMFTQALRPEIISFFAPTL